ncbi:glycosyltransferase family 4 protein [Protaetiibacter mangrovi]|uniref:Glycosyltransferase family 4 protein n=1 Tax=Protaetiibacter mangrovi TaxID=2970926 RepID=A0ABT1ZFJ3_9MICO|nr:glycosyltransferase family 1 protein [Protaetiibacter mangrovi]MCS0499462.1 glycosyltransferase family 4 protein [Protaetiibacter mangrovi]TPX03763.1 glycosyltransferase family 4 protein [Schumannella luteola]
MTDAPEVALSMLTLVPGAMGGSETYARELTRQLATTEQVAATAYVPANAGGFSRGIPEVVVPQVRTGASTTERLRAVATATLRRPALPAGLRTSRIVHYPFTIPVPRPAASQAFVQTLLDVQHLDLPQLFGRAELAFRRRYYEGAAKRADAVITISEFARTRMIELLGIPAERIRVAHLGVDADDYTPYVGPRQEFVLYPARGWKHKNHARLVEAMREVRRERPELRLVLTGGGLDTLGELPEWVDVRGLVSGEELRELYRSASVLAFPSLYEGFGLPPLEAMASGCPVAATDAGSVPEVCGDAAVLFDAGDPSAIAAGILEALGRADELSARGLEQVRLFTWQRCLDAHLDVYRSVA